MEDLVIAETDAAIAEFHGDPSRIYLTGFSMGGAGVYGIAERWPDRFAGLVAIGGPVNDIDPLVTRISRLPIRIYHGGVDERVPVQRTRELVAALKKADANLQYTEYPDTDHGGSAEKAYAERDLISWLFAQRRSGASR